MAGITKPTTKVVVQQPSPTLIQNYSNCKAAIFSRYRTLSELLGVLLLQEGQKYVSVRMRRVLNTKEAYHHYHRI